MVLSAVFGTDALAPSQRLDPEQLVADLGARGTKASFIDGVEAIVERVAGGARPGDVVLVMSNGGFEGIHERLLAALGAEPRG